VDQGLDEETERLYSTGNQAAILGGDSLLQLVKSEHEQHKQLINQHQGNYQSINTIIEAVANEFCMEVKELTKSRRGRGSENIPRWVVLYLCRELSQTSLKVIAGEFGIARISGVSRAVYKLKLILDADIQASLKALYQQLTA